MHAQSDINPRHSPRKCRQPSVESEFGLKVLGKSLGPAKRSLIHAFGYWSRRLDQFAKVHIKIWPDIDFSDFAIISHFFDQVLCFDESFPERLSAGPTMLIRLYWFFALPFKFTFTYRICHRVFSTFNTSLPRLQAATRWGNAMIGSPMMTASKSLRLRRTLKSV